MSRSRFLLCGALALALGCTDQPTSPAALSDGAPAPVFNFKDRGTKAGFMTSEMTNFAGTMTITVWYPTSMRANGLSEYEFEGLFGVATLVPAGATRGAPIKGGTFPLIVTYPGAGGPDSRFIYFPNNELLAADGYVVVTPGRNTSALVDQGPLLSSLIDHMLLEHPLRNSIDASRIGAKGMSFGGFGVASLAGGDFLGALPDTRVRGVIIDEGVVRCGVDHDCTSATIPVMFRNGGTLGDISDMAPELAAFDNAFPRFLVTVDNVSHASYVTGFCALAEAARLASLAYQEDVLGRIVEPEPRNLSYFSISLGNGDGSGSTASFVWNIDVFFGGGSGNFGSAGDFCRSEFGGPDTGVTSLDERTMIETLHATDLGFWQTVFGHAQGKKTKLEKAVERLETVESFVKVLE